MTYIVDWGRNKFVKTTLKDAVKKAYSMAEFGSEIHIYQIVKDKIIPVGTVVELRPEKDYSGKSKKKSIYALFRSNRYGTGYTQAHIVKSDGTVMPKIDILNIKYYSYFNHDYYFNDRLSKAEREREAVNQSFHHRRR